MKNNFVSTFLVGVLFCYTSVLLADELRAIVDVKAYNFPGGKSSISKTMYSYKQGDMVKVNLCVSSSCQVLTPSGVNAWVLAFKLTPDTDIAKAHEIYKKSGAENWNTVDIAVWGSIHSNINKLDQCALKLAHKIKINPSKDWPAYCNTFRNTPEVLDRVKTIESITRRLKLSDEDYTKIKKGTIWINAPKDAVIVSWGTPKEIRNTITASGKKEQWIYDINNYVYITNGKVSGIQN